MEAARKVGLEVNFAKTKVLMGEDCDTAAVQDAIVAAGMDVSAATSAAKFLGVWAVMKQQCQGSC